MSSTAGATGQTARRTALQYLRTPQLLLMPPILGALFLFIVRSLMLGGTDAAGVGHSTGYWVALSLAWCLGIIAVFSGLAVARFARTR